MKRNLFITVALLLLSSLTASFAQIKPQSAPKKSLIGDYMSIGGYINSQYSFESQELNDGTMKESNTFQIRRARLDIKGNITKNIEFRLQSDLSKSPVLVDAFIKVKFNPYINVQVGQFKVPFSIENPYSPLNLESIDNAQVISALSGFSDVSGISSYKYGRDLGFMLYGGFFNKDDFQLINYSIGIFNGNGINVKDNNMSKDIAGRLEFHPWIKELVISGSIYIGEYKLEDKENATRDRYGVGGEYKNDRFVFRSEYLWGVTGMDITDEVNTLVEGKTIGDKKSDGYYAVASYKFKLGKEGKQTLAPVLRYDYYNENTEAIETASTASTYYMLGLDWWPEKHLRFQLNYTLRDKASNDKLGHAVAAMLSVKF